MGKKNGFVISGLKKKSQKHALDVTSRKLKTVDKLFTKVIKY